MEMKIESFDQSNELSHSKHRMDSKNSIRRWCGIVWLIIELNLCTANIFGFPALFKILPKYGIYESQCQTVNSNNATTLNCLGQTTQYQNALTLGILFFNLPSIFVGVFIDFYGSRFIKLIGIIFHIVGWLSLALVQPGRDYLLFFYTLFTSLAGIIVQLTAYASCEYFPKSRAFLTTLLVGASASSSIWDSVFQVLVDNQSITLSNLAYIWMSFGILLLISSFLFLDWKFPILNLPYKYAQHLEESTASPLRSANEPWWFRIRHRLGIWEHLTSPLYILVVLFLTFLMMPSILLSVTWYPWVSYITNYDLNAADRYTFAFNISSLSSIALCPIAGFLIGFRAEKSKQRKLLNLSLVQTFAWLWVLISCIVYMFPRENLIVPALVLYYIGRSTVIAGAQAVIATYFPSEYIGRLIGIMWTTVGAITSIQYGLVKLTINVTDSWRAWLIVLALVVVMVCHVIQIWKEYIKERRNNVKIGTKV